MGIKNGSNSFAYLAATIAIILWGFSFVWTNSLLINEVPIFTYLFIRLAIAGLLLVTISKSIKKLQKVKGRDLLWMALMAFCEPFIYFLGETYGMLATGSATIAAVIIATIPIFCLVVEKLIWRIPFNIYKVCGIILTVPGIVMVVFQEGAISIEHAYGIALLFMAVCASIGYAMVVKRLTDKYNTITITTYQFAFGAIFFLPFFLIYGLDGVTARLLAPEIAIPLLSLAVLCSCLCFGLWIYSIGKLGITRTNIFSALIPSISAVGAFAIGQEQLSVIRIAGIAIVIAGVILAQIEKRA
ncbi:MAG: DMT family transporter [Bacteroidales bacterium]|nr:DMT family transporter [Bacteroidales bacterium]